jgi:hypothetical protein
MAEKPYGASGLGRTGIGVPTRAVRATATRSDADPAIAAVIANETSQTIKRFRKRAIFLAAASTLLGRQN